MCDAGLWGWSRHPNYFFEWLGWLAYPLLAIDPAAAILAGSRCPAPAFMYWLLVYVSGIPPLEQQMLRSRGDAYRDYQARVSAFFFRCRRGGPDESRRRRHPRRRTRAVARRVTRAGIALLVGRTSRQAAPRRARCRAAFAAEMARIRSR